MRSKQDRQGARTPADLTRRYNFTQSFSKVMTAAGNAQASADTANNRVDELGQRTSFQLTNTEGYYSVNTPDGVTPGGMEYVHTDIGSVGYGVLPEQEETEENVGEDLSPQVFKILENLVDGTSLVIRLQSGRVYVTGLTAPVEAADAVNKEYVDALEARVKALEEALGLTTE